MEHPVFKNRLNLLFHFGIWALVMSVHILVIYSTVDIPLQLILLEGFVFYTLLAFLSLGIYYATRFNKIENTSTVNIFINHASSAVLLIFIWQLI